MNLNSGPAVNPVDRPRYTTHADSMGEIPLNALVVALGLTMLLVFALDFMTPMGIAIWALYLLPMSLSLWAMRPEVPLYTATVATLLILVTSITDDAMVAREIALTNRGFGLFGIWVLGGVGHFFIRYKLAVVSDRWIQTGQMRLNAVLQGEQTRQQLGTNLLSFLVDYLGAEAGVLYSRDHGEFRRISTVGAAVESGVPEQFQVGEGLLGKVARDAAPSYLQKLPSGYLRIQSALGHADPAELIIQPIIIDDIVNTVIEFGFFGKAHADSLELLGRSSSAIGAAIRSANYRAHLQNLLEETQRQAEELQTQSEELRVSNEELEEQGRALRETQSRLVQQQAELEATNVQLEEQTQLLETQRDELAITQADLQLKARELEQSSQYKSDFLANMSHELRTPLNSSLILAKLLADNSDGNLTGEQVKFAETILSSGNDLLTLINDILDLSKIEAGRMDMRPEEVSVSQVFQDLKRIFEPLAGQKGLELKFTGYQSIPHRMVTDRQRLEQVLKNLLSNAIKFTETGSVELSVATVENDQLAFTVADTGIGIPLDQQEVIFEAFRQADGTASRKFGGTGLGLSISRELTRLLGGKMSLDSHPGQGSAFTVIIPREYAAGRVSPRQPLPVVAPPHLSGIRGREGSKFPAGPTSSQQGARGAVSFDVVPADKTSGGSTSFKASSTGTTFDDDRGALNAQQRILLVVEDDPAFAQILYRLAHEQDFQCLVATNAEDATVMAIQYLPSAVVLDVGLPDHSGLSVLDRLKHDSRTRHIPVHVVSAEDFEEAALSLGAVGFLIKPVNRDELVSALKRMETRFSQRMQRVLVVEDDEVQLESLRRLLASQSVATEGVQSAAACLERLRNETFDCMVLDLTLPDATGYSLLETLSQEDAYAFPPVIVYTGRDLSADEEQQLRRYSKSIIIKGAKSPERLLDEVTLFLHQVVADLPPQQQRMLEKARSRDAILEGRRILIVEDDVRNVFALTSILEQRGVVTQIARNGKEALTALDAVAQDGGASIDLVLMDVMMPEMDGLTATQEIRRQHRWNKLPIIMLTAKAMKDDQEQCLAAGANDYLSKPLDVDKLLSLIRVWISR